LCFICVSSRIWFAGCCESSILQNGHITLSSTPDQQLENHSTKYHRQQPLYDTLELLMMGIVVPETCWASNKICNKNLCCIYLAFYFHILTTMHSQNHIKRMSVLDCMFYIFTYYCSFNTAWMSHLKIMFQTWTTSVFTLRWRIHVALLNTN